MAPYPAGALVSSSRHMVRHAADVLILLSAMAGKPNWLLTHNTKHFTQAIKADGTAHHYPPWNSSELSPQYSAMHLAQGANAKPAFFDSRNSPPPSNGMNLRFQDHQNRVRSDLAVPAEKRNMAYQRGSLKKVRRKEGEIWVLRYRVTHSTGKGVENVMPIGLVQEFPKDEDARRKADRLGPSVRINDSSLPGRVRFDFLAEHYLRADFGGDAVRPKLVNTISHVEQIVRAYLILRFGNEIAEDIKPLDIQRWLKSLHDSNSLAWTTISKMRGVMRRIYKIGILH